MNSAPTDSPQQGASGPASGYGSPRHHRGPPLFALMLLAFMMVIVLGVCGMVGMVGLTVGHEYMTHKTETPIANGSVPTHGIPPFPAGPTNMDYTPPQGVQGGDFARGLLSGALVLVAMLLLLSTVFSRRISRPISKLTAAARAMAAGDMSVRVSGNRVRELNELAEAFNSMAGSIAESDKQRRQLTADVAHELRTPLSIIKGRLEGIQDGVYETSPEQVTLLLDETALLERMIEDLRILAQADAGQLPLYLEQVRPGDLLQSAARYFAPQAEAAGVAICVEASDSLPEVQADPQRISQVVSNLISNALRYTPAEGTITLRAWIEPSEPGYVIFSLRDTGSGIAPEDLPYIFDRFWKADKARSRSGGAGLGLAIARRIVEAHGGRIWAMAGGGGGAPGQGTTVGFTLRTV